MSGYKTILKNASAEEIIKKSRFIGFARPVSTEEEAVAFVETIKKEHRNATHNVPVYLLGKKYDVQRYSDDGEPSGTAGVPVLEMLKKEGITNVALVITRYFGGIKLGTGGLVRAYTQTAKSALKAAQIVEKKPYEKVELCIPYTFQGSIMHFFNNQTEFLKKDVVYTDNVTIEAFVPQNTFESFANSVTKITSGQENLRKEGEVLLTVCEGNILEIN